MTQAYTEGSVSVSVSILGEMQLDRALAGRIRATSDLSQPFEHIADDFEEEQEKRFEHEGSLDGAKAWPALSPDYAAWKEQHYPGRKILVRTGKLRDALTGGPGSVRTIGRLKLVLSGTRLVKGKSGIYDLGALHFTGTSKMPARRPMAIGKRQKHRWMRFFSDHFRIEGRFDD